MGRYERCRNVKSCLNEVHIHYKTSTISLLKENIVKHLNANVTSFPYTTPDGLTKILKTTAAYKYEVMLPNAVNLEWNGKTKILIDVGMSFYGATQGKLLHIRITCPCNVDPLTPHFYIVKLGFTGVNIIFLFLL